MEQGSKEWLEWRKQGIGASEVAALVGASPWSTPYQVWLDKTRRKAAFEGNAATIRGQELESKARSRYELETLEDMPPGIATHPKYEICRASLDGIRADKKLILEIKCMGAANHALAMSGVIPEYYIPQIQFQLAVTGADMCHFFAFGPDESSQLIEVLPDIKMQGELIATVLEFWEKHIIPDVAPPLTDKDDKEVEEKDFLDLFRLVEAGQEKMREVIIQQGGHNRIRCGKYLLTKSKTKTGKDTYRLTVKKDEVENKEVG